MKKILMKAKNLKVNNIKTNNQSQAMSYWISIKLQQNHLKFL